MIATWRWGQWETLASFKMSKLLNIYYFSSEGSLEGTNLESSPQISLENLWKFNGWIRYIQKSKKQYLKFTFNTEFPGDLRKFPLISWF